LQHADRKEGISNKYRMLMGRYLDKERRTRKETLRSISEKMVMKTGIDEHSRIML
jgi:hypothetical protein